jgi:hypothetical protein
MTLPATEPSSEAGHVVITYRVPCTAARCAADFGWSGSRLKGVPSPQATSYNTHSGNGTAGIGRARERLGGIKTQEGACLLRSPSRTRCNTNWRAPDFVLIPKGTPGQKARRKDYEQTSHTLSY